MLKRPRILLADDHPLVLEGVARILNDEFHVVGTVEDGHALVLAAQQLNPDIIVTDISMPSQHGLDAIQEILSFHPTPKIIFLTMHADVIYAKKAFELGGSGFLLKRSAGSELIDAIHQILQGKTYLTPLLFPNNQLPICPELHQQRVTLKNLTPRQREVLNQIVIGKTIKEISTLLSISVKTVEFHKTKLMESLHLQTKADLTKFALAHELLPPDLHTHVSSS